MNLRLPLDSAKRHRPHTTDGARTPHAARPLRRWRHLREQLILFGGFTLLGIGCLSWAAIALPLLPLFRCCRAARFGRRVAMLGFRTYLFALHLMGAARFDLTALDELRDAGPLILAANHPGLLDAPMVLSRLPSVVCILKASLLDNVFWGAGARLACYIRNDRFLGSVHQAIDELGQGSQLLLFPEGSRTSHPPLDRFLAGAAIMAHRSGMPVQTLIIEQDTCFLGKGQPLFACPDMPMHFRIRLGRRFDAPTDPREFTRNLHAYFEQELRVTAEAVSP